MKKLFGALRNYLRSSDTLLLVLCVLCSIYGIVLISSATGGGANKFIIVQSLALVLGIVLYFLFSVIDLDIIGDKWKLLLIGSYILIALLFKFGTSGGSGNRAWIRFGGIGIQPAEITKIPFIILLAKLVVSVKNSRGINHPFSVIKLLLLFGSFFGLIIIASSDMGSALVYFCIFAIVLFAAGLNPLWFLAGLGAIAAIMPYAWNNFFTEKQRARILAPYDSSIDPDGLGITWQANQSKAAISAGNFTGQGLGKGYYTQNELVPKQHTDFIFSVSGEELGLVGASLIIILLMLIIIRCIYTGIKSNDPTGMLVSVGVAAMLIFQVFENIGMCIGLAPVIGLTLPFFSYGGSSLVTVFAAMGIVSGVRMRPKPSSFIRDY